MRIWRAGPEYIVARGEGFWVIRPDGEIERHEPRVTSDEDALWRVSFEVRDGALVEHTIVEDRGRTRRDFKLLVRGLVETSDPIARESVRAVLGDDAVSAKEARAQREREADARVAAIRGARPGAGALAADLARAEALLTDRVRSYADPLAAALLGTLLEIGAAPVAASARASFVRGCLHACFVREDLAASPVPVAERIGPPLAAAILARARELDAAGEAQDDIDARGNAVAYYKAAAAVRAAAAE